MQTRPNQIFPKLNLIGQDFIVKFNFLKLLLDYQISSILTRTILRYVGRSCAEGELRSGPLFVSLSEKSRKEKIQVHDITFLSSLLVQRGEHFQ